MFPTLLVLFVLVEITIGSWKYQIKRIDLSGLNSIQNKGRNYHTHLDIVFILLKQFVGENFERFLELSLPLRIKLDFELTSLINKNLKERTHWCDY